MEVQKQLHEQLEVQRQLQPAHRRTCKIFAEDIRTTTKGKGLLIHYEKFNKRERGSARIHRERGNQDERRHLFRSTVRTQNFRY